MSQKLSNKVAIVTGASKGIGAAIAKQLAAEGASVVVNYASDKNGAESVVNYITAHGGKAIAVKGDVSVKADLDQLFAEAGKAYSQLDILVNNAGIFEFQNLEEITEENFHKQFNINVLGLILATQKAVAAFGSKGGSVVNISSAISHSPFPGAAVYSATKAAVDAVTKSFSKELGSRNIRVNALNPGMVETEGTHTAQFIGGDMQKQIEAQTPLGRIGQPEDIARVAAFLASDEAGWISGETLIASGGQR